MLTFLSRYKFSASLAASAASWGVATVISKRAVQEIAPLTLLAIQLAVSVGALAVVLAAQRVKVQWSPQMRRLAWLGVINPGMSYALGLVGLSQITASMSVLLWATEPLIILVLAAWLLNERITSPVAGSSVIALIGVVLVGFQAGAGGKLVGVALTLVGVALCAIYTIAARKLTLPDSTMAVVAVQQSSALVFALALIAGAFLLGLMPALPPVSAVAWASAAVSGVLYYAVAFWFYLTGLRRTPAAIAGSFLNLIPMFGIAAGYVLLDERLTGRQWIGAVLIVGAVAAILRLQGRHVAHLEATPGA